MSYGIIIHFFSRGEAGVAILSPLCVKRPWIVEWKRRKYGCEIATDGWCGPGPSFWVDGGARGTFSLLPTAHW